jgi:hypothetical protein
MVGRNTYTSFNCWLVEKNSRLKNNLSKNSVDLMILGFLSSPFA